MYAAALGASGETRNERLTIQPAKTLKSQKVTAILP